jgi:hypothetical protein
MTEKMIQKMWQTIAILVILVIGCLLALKNWPFMATNQETKVNKIPEQPLAVNIVDKPLYIKDLTTGVLYDFAKLPKPSFQKNQLILLDYQYFGDIRKVSIDLNKKGQIYKIKVSLGLFADKLHSTIEEKVSAENGKSIRFLCKESKTDLSAFGFKNSTLLSDECILKYGTQRLILETNRPKGDAAVMGISLNSASLTLEDDSLKKVEVEQVTNEHKRALDEAEKKAKSDI